MYMLAQTDALAFYYSVSSDAQRSDQRSIFWIN